MVSFWVYVFVFSHEVMNSCGIAIEKLGDEDLRSIVPFFPELMGVLDQASIRTVDDIFNTVDKFFPELSSKLYGVPRDGLMCPEIVWFLRYCHRVIRSDLPRNQGKVHHYMNRIALFGISGMLFVILRCSDCGILCDVFTRAATEWVARGCEEHWMDTWSNSFPDVNDKTKLGNVLLGAEAESHLAFVMKRFSMPNSCCSHNTSAIRFDVRTKSADARKVSSRSSDFYSLSSIWLPCAQSSILVWSFFPRFDIGFQVIQSPQ